MKLITAAAVSALILVSGAAQAAGAQKSSTYNLSVADPSAKLGNVASFGTVNVTENAGKLDFSVSLAEGFVFHQNNSTHHAFTFELLKDPAITFSGLSAGFTALNVKGGSAPAAAITEQPFGTNWDYGIDCNSLGNKAAGSGCRAGYNKANPTSLSFTVASSAGLSLASLESTSYGGKSIYFAADVANAAGRTGNVGAVFSANSAIQPTAPVPEPSEWAMLLAGLGVVGGAAHRRRARA